MKRKTLKKKTNRKLWNQGKKDKLGNYNNTKDRKGTIFT